MFRAWVRLPIVIIGRVRLSIQFAARFRISDAIEVKARYRISCQ